MVFELKHYDTTLITFDYENHSLSGEHVQFLFVNEQKKNLFPIGLELNEKGLISWLRSRVIPKNREYVENILSEMGLSSNNTIGIIKICKGLSLNDCYWVVESGFQGSFDEYNLYENHFKIALSSIAFFGQGKIKTKDFISSPEFTTNGMLKKCWRREDGKIYLYKGGTSGGINTGKEPYSEFYASQVASVMEIKHVDYNLKKWKGVLSSVCELFTSKQASFVPIWRFIQSSSLLEIGDTLKKFGEEIYQEFVDMLVFDALIYNTDRHTGNFGLLLDNNTNQIIGFAPIFDNGLSLFNYAMEKDLEHLSTYSKTRVPALGGSYEDIVAHFIEERQKAKLRKMIHFQFKKHTRYNLPEKRRKLIEDYLQIRVRELLQL